jgi:hypothetical protein
MSKNERIDALAGLREKFFWFFLGTTVQKILSVFYLLALIISVLLGGLLAYSATYIDDSGAPVTDSDILSKLIVILIFSSMLIIPLTLLYLVLLLIYLFAYPRLQEYLGKRALEKRLFDEEQRKKGLVQHGGRWVTPEEKYRLEGYVKHGAEWVTIEEKYRRDGYVRYMGKWVKKEEYDALMAEVHKSVSRFVKEYGEGTGKQRRILFDVLTKEKGLLIDEYELHKIIKAKYGSS